MTDAFEKKIEKLQEIIDDTYCGVLFTGAGISVPSGIPDFRSAGGLYSTPYGDFSPEYMLSHDCYSSNPESFFKFYKEKMLYPDAKPNPAHKYFAELEKRGRLAATVTQNIDGLHQAAGAERVYELHGSVKRNYCADCGEFFDLDYIIRSKGAPHCDKCGGRVKPDVVLYGEGLDEDVVSGAVNAIAAADTVFVVGTSLVVYPAAGLLRYFKGKNLVLINKSRTDYDGRATLSFNDDVLKVTEALKS